MDPTLVQIGIALGSTVVGSAVTGAIWYGAVKAWMARREEREASLREDVRDHEERLRVLERGPMDFAR